MKTQGRIAMTKSAFLKSIEEAPDNALVLTADCERCRDGDYHQARPEVTTILVDSAGAFTEDLGEDLTPESEHGKRIPCIVII
jgi:hypothetical protein